MVVDLPDYRLIVGDLRTGQVQASLPMADVKWGQRLNASGPVQATLRPRSKQLRRYDLANLTAAVKQFMAVEYRGTLLEGGPIWTQGESDDGTELKLAGLGLWSIFDRRKNLNWGDLLAGKPAQESLMIIQRGHLGAIAREYVRESIVANPSGDLPVALPPDIPGTDHIRTVHGYHLGWIGDDLRELTKVQGGPDLRFRPRYVEGDPSRVEWAFEHGAEDVLIQDGPDWTWDARVERPALGRIGVNRDGTGVAARVWVPGSGTEQAMKVGTYADNTLTNAGYPYLEAEESGSDEEDPDVLTQQARRLQADSVRPWDQWTLNVQADRYPALGSYLPGDWALVNPPEDHPIIPESTGKVRVRILAVDGDGSSTVKLSVAPIQGSV